MAITTRNLQTMLSNVSSLAAGLDRNESQRNAAAPQNLYIRRVYIGRDNQVHVSNSGFATNNWLGKMLYGVKSSGMDALRSAVTAATSESVANKAIANFADFDVVTAKYFGNSIRDAQNEIQTVSNRGAAQASQAQMDKLGGLQENPGDQATQMGSALNVANAASSSALPVSASSAILQPVSAAATVVISSVTFDHARKKQVPDFSFNNYNKGFPGGVCNGASIVWLNLMAQGRTHDMSKIDTDPGLINQIRNLQGKIECAELSTFDMKEKNALNASRFDLFGGPTVNVAGQYVGDVATRKASERSNIEAVANGVAKELRSAGDFAFVQLSSDQGNGHACAIFRDANDKVHFFDPDKGAYSFDFDAAGVASLGATVVNSMNSARDKLTLVFGSM